MSVPEPVGHGEVRARLAAALPPVVLLAGPASVGKWTLARWAAERHTLGRADRSEFAGLSMGDARDLRLLAVFRPLGKLRIFAVKLDGASAGALDALLKAIEEPPPYVRYLLTASSRPPPTVVSRCRVYTCRPLADAEVAEVLRREFGMDDSMARRQAPLGEGSVLPAVRAGELARARPAVLAALRAASSHDYDLLRRATRDWGEGHHWLLERWALEAACGHWLLFSAGDSRAGHVTARRILGALGRAGQARPKLAAQAIFEELSR